MIKAQCRICRQCACRKCHPAICEGVNRSRRFFLLGALALPVAPKALAAPVVKPVTYYVSTYVIHTLIKGSPEWPYAWLEMKGDSK